MKCGGGKKKKVQYLEIFGWSECQIPKLPPLKKKKKKSYSSFPYTLMTPTHLLPSLAFLPSESAR